MHPSSPPTLHGFSGRNWSGFLALHLLPSGPSVCAHGRANFDFDHFDFANVSQSGLFLSD